MSSDAELLRRAADLVRTRAAAATEGPLRLARYDGMGRKGGGRLAVAEPDVAPLRAGRRVLVADFYREGDREWYAATVTPGIGPPLAALLEAAAVDEETHNPSGGLRSAFTDHALGVAREIVAASEIEDLP